MRQQLRIIHFIFEKAPTKSGPSLFKLGVIVLTLLLAGLPKCQG